LTPTKRHNKSQQRTTCTSPRTWASPRTVACRNCRCGRRYVRNTVISHLNERIRNNDIENVRLLIKSVENLDAVDSDDYSPLMCAAGMENLAICSEIVAMGADVNFQSVAGTTALHIAVLESIANQVHKSGELGHENEEIVSFLLKNGASPELKDIYGSSALDIASESNVLKVLMNYHVL